jgi:DNA polymerase III subunit delta
MSNYKEKIEKEAAYKLFESDLKKNSDLSLILMYGSEAYLIQWAISELIGKYINPFTRDFDLVRINGINCEMDTIKSHCETLPLGSEKKIVIIENYKIFSLEESEQREIIDYIDKIPMEVLLIFVNESADSRKRLYKYINENGTVYEFKALDQANLKKFIEKRMKIAQKGIKPSLINEIILKSGYLEKNSTTNLYDIENDLKKIIDHSDTDEIVLKDITDTFTGNMENDIFVLVDAVLKGKKSIALSMLNNLLYFGESEYRILAMICSQIEKLLIVKEVNDEYENFAQVIEILGMNEYVLRKNITISKGYSLSRLRKLLIEAYSIDGTIKKGNLDKRLALEMFVIAS